MVEILVAVLILSIGLLGLAGLQLSSMRNNHSAYQRTQATILAYDIVDRMLANRSAITAGSYATAEANDNECTANTCTPQQMAEYDLYDWNAALAQALPSGQGTIATNGTITTITVMWDDERTGATGTNCSGNPDVDLTCFLVRMEL